MKSSSSEPSSPPRVFAFQGLPDEVTEIALKAQNVQTLHPAVAAMLEEPKKKADFLHRMFRHVQSIQSRSQALEDPPVTVYDKTLLTLTQNGNKLDHPPAIEYYCDRFLGVSNIADQVRSTRMLEQSVSLPKHLTQRYTPPPSDPRCSIESFEAQTETETQRRRSNVTLTSFDKSSNFSRGIPEMEPQVARLWSLYENARADFQGVLPKKDHQATADSARFLRDTAENTIQYLKGKDFDAVMMAELHAVNDLAKATAVSATGGKKRKFDVAGTEQVKKDGHGCGRAERAPSNVQRRDRYAPYSGSHRGSHDRYNTYQRMEPGRSHRSARGPSGIPFGYSRSRPVDSYQPY